MLANRRLRDRGAAGEEGRRPPRPRSEAQSTRARSKSAIRLVRWSGSPDFLTRSMGARRSTEAACSRLAPTTSSRRRTPPTC